MIPFLVGGIGANHVLLVVKRWNLACGKFAQKKYYDTQTHPQTPIKCILQTRINRITIGQNIFFSLKVLLLYTVENYIEMKQFNKIPLKMKMNW